MKKLIDIPDEILQDLKILAVKENKDLKNFIQDKLIDLVSDGRKKQNNDNLSSKHDRQAAVMCWAVYQH